MSKLFAFENADVVGDEVELETPVEAGEVADAELEVVEEVGELESQETAIDEGTEAAGQLEEVEALVEQAAEEGLRGGQRRVTLRCGAGMRPALTSVACRRARR